MDDKPDQPSSLVQAAESLVDGLEGWLRSISEGLIASGEIDPTGMTERQLFLAAARFVASNPDFFEASELSVSHEETLLDQARRYVQDEKPSLAVVMYATWIEHRLNLLLIFGGREKGLSPQECEQLVRANLPFKIGAMWTLLYGQPLDEETRKDIALVAQERNAFVHYKWPAASTSEPYVVPERQPPVILAAERAVSALEQEYRAHVLRGYAPEPEES